MKLTEKLDLLMKKKGITKADLSREAGIPYTTIASLYDKGYENVKLSTLKKLADYFNCSLDYIADDNIEENDNKSRTGPTTIAAHFDGKELTPEEAEEINNFVKYVLSKRNK